MKKQRLTYQILSPNERRLLFSWQKSFYKASLPVWVMIALSQSPKTVDELQQSLADMTTSHLLPREQSLYRALRRWEADSLLAYQSVKSSVGPDYKQYRLTPVGKKVWAVFIQQQLLDLYRPAVSDALYKARDYS